jgi:hypothetical protein
MKLKENLDLIGLISAIIGISMALILIVLTLGLSMNEVIASYVNWFIASGCLLAFGMVVLLSVVEEEK